MKSSHGRILVVLITGLMLLAGSAIGSYAANGGPLLLGHKNSATKTTTLKNSKGTALSLKSKTGTAPLKVSNSTTVAKLSADLLDGQDSTALRTKSYTYSLTAPTQTDDYTFFSLAGLPSGKYLASVNLNAAVSGAASGFVCFIINASSPVTTAPVLIPGVLSSGVWFVNGGGYIDTTALPLRFGCQRLGGTDHTIPAIPQFPASLTLTRVDDATAGALTGTSAVAPRGAGLAGVR
jgi:hypothetical protein